MNVNYVQQTSIIACFEIKSDFIVLILISKLTSKEGINVFKFGFFFLDKLT